jgi:hypothetical protein
VIRYVLRFLNISRFENALLAVFTSCIRRLTRYCMQSTGLKLVSDPSQDEQMIPSLLAFKKRIDAILKGPFVGDTEFGHTGKDAFEWFINKRQNKPAEMIGEVSRSVRPNLGLVNLAAMYSAFSQVYRSEDEDGK